MDYSCSKLVNNCLKVLLYFSFQRVSKFEEACLFSNKPEFSLYNLLFALDFAKLSP